MRLYRLFAASLVVVFAVVGILFLFCSQTVVAFFNTLSASMGFAMAPVPAPHFYHILAVAYMYLVTLLAILMCLHPQKPGFPFLLTHAKIASSLLSLGFFIFHQPYLIYLANFIVDGVLGLTTYLFYRKIK